MSGKYIERARNDIQEENGYKAQKRNNTHALRNKERNKEKSQERKRKTRRKRESPKEKRKL